MEREIALAHAESLAASIQTMVITAMLAAEANDWERLHLTLKNIQSFASRIVKVSVEK